MTTPPSPTPAPGLRATGIEKRYGSQEVLRGIDLDLSYGQVTVLLGENGAGKTTLMRVLAGDLLADRAAIQVEGLDLRTEPEAARARLVYVAQHPPLAPLLTLREHVQALVAFRQLDPAETQHELIRLTAALGLSAALDKPVRALSGGMAHKAALVLAFLSKARVILLDEPHSGLDVRSAIALRKLILAARDQGAAVLLASHLAEATLAVADRAWVMRAGRIALNLGPQELAAFGGDARRFEEAVLRGMTEGSTAD
jgi:ABC-type multidrug transport system ATPase subunit